MEKYKSSQLSGIYNHNERVFKNHSNKDIDPSRSHLNYELTNRDRTQTYHKQIKEHINENRISSRGIRKDAVLCNEWVITSDKTFFESLDQEQTKNSLKVLKTTLLKNMEKLTLPMLVYILMKVHHTCIWELYQ